MFIVYQYLLCERYSVDATTVVSFLVDSRLCGGHMSTPCRYYGSARDRLFLGQYLGTALSYYSVSVMTYSISQLQCPVIQYTPGTMYYQIPVYCCTWWCILLYYFLPRTHYCCTRYERASERRLSLGVQSLFSALSVCLRLTPPTPFPPTSPPRLR